MARWLKQSTSVDLPIGPFLDSTDGITAETGLTITQPDVRLKKNGGAWAQKNAAQTLSHEENGFYEVTLDATDTDTLGQLRLAVFETGAVPVWEDFLVVTANAWDTFCGADLLDVSLVQVAGSALNTAAAQIGVNVVQIKAQTVPDPAVPGRPLVDVSHWGGTAIGSVNPNVNIAQIDGNAGSATRLKQGVKTTTTAVVDAGSTTSSIVFASTDPASVVDDQFNGLVIAFTQDTTTAALRGQKATITNWVHATLTATIDPPLTNAPAAGDTATFM